MTDLERVREFIGLHTTPTKAIELQAIVDAHLEEDAEKAADAFAVEGQLHEKLAELEVENAKLREKLQVAESYLTGDDRDAYFAELEFNEREFK